MAGVAGLGYALAGIELPEGRAQELTSFVCAVDVAGGCNAENAIASFHGEEDRTYVPLDQVPQVMVDAVLAAEDRDFFSHGGIDPMAIVRALWHDLRNESTQGGSTITQQYVKAVYLSSERTLTRKIREAVLAVKVEQRLTKQEILERYLNAIYFGRGAYGVSAASRSYFGHDLSAMNLAEAAYLAGLIRSPETADPIKDPDRARARRRTVLEAMAETGRVSAAELAAADADRFDNVIVRTPRQGLGEVEGEEFGTEYVVAYVKRQLEQMGFSDAEIFGGGLRVYTTLDMAMQRQAYEAVTRTLDQPDDPNAALVALDQSGHIKAMVGGTDFDRDQVNSAVPPSDGGGSGRQPGSSFKPFVLAAALDQGISLSSRFESPSRLVLRGADGGRDWVVNNAEQSAGVLSLVEATRHSSNTVFAQLMTKVTPAVVVPLAERMGISADLPEVSSLVLGAGEVSPLDMAAAYSTLARRGTHVPPTVITRVERPDGSVVDFPQPRTEVLDEAVADQVIYAMQQVVLGGTGAGANPGFPVAGKTGTTDDYRDAWFVGFAPNGFTTAVWMGYPNPPGEPPRYMDDVHGRRVHGGTFPATIWRRFMADALDGVDTGRFVAPNSFPGTVLGANLTTTTSSTSTSSTSSSSVPRGPTTTTADPPGTTTPTTSASTTSTTSAPPTTTEAAPDEGEAKPGGLRPVE